MRYKDKIVWITGASSGIGKAMAEAYYRDGARLILSSRRREVLEQVKAELDSESDRIVVLPLDLAKTESLEKKAKEALTLFGGIDILVNNGGISQRSLFVDTEPQIIQKLMDINFIGTMILTHEVLPNMIAQRSGQIIVTASVTGKVGTKFRTGYAASKHALYGFFDSLRQELYGYNIAVTVLCPGFIKTDVSVNALTADGKAFGKVGDKHANAMEPELMVKKIWKKIAARKEEIIVAGFEERVAMLIKRISPKLLNKILRKSKVV